MTTLVRFDPVREVAAMHTELSRLMNGLFESNGRQTQAWVPSLDAWETDDSVVYAFDLPGLTRGEIEVEVEDGALTVSATRVAPERAEGDRFHHYERRFGSFARTVGLPPGVSEDAVEATYTNGVLEIRIPKPEQPRPKRIEVSGDGATAHPTIEGKAS
jgi:HSP20 family protein